MPVGIYDHGMVWCSFCQEKREPNPPHNICPDCKHMMRTTPKSRAGKERFKVRQAERESVE